MKLLRLFGAIFSLSLKRELTFRAEFVFQLLLTATGITLQALQRLGLYTPEQPCSAAGAWEKRQPCLEHFKS